MYQAYSGYHNAREAIPKLEVDLCDIESAGNAAKLLSKPLAKKVLLYHRDTISVRPQPSR